MSNLGDGDRLSQRRSTSDMVDLEHEGNERKSLSVEKIRII